MRLEHLGLEALDSRIGRGEGIVIWKRGYKVKWRVVLYEDLG